MNTITQEKEAVKTMFVTTMSEMMKIEKELEIEKRKSKRLEEELKEMKDKYEENYWEIWEWQEKLNRLNCQSCALLFGVVGNAV